MCRSHPVGLRRSRHVVLHPYAPDDTTAQVVFTLEGLYPITGVKSLPLDTSVDQG